jgi:hypothetical protein
MPGRRISWRVRSVTGVDTVSWEVFTNVYNKSYIYCHSTKSIAYFQNDGVYFYFTHFEVIVIRCCTLFIWLLFGFL